MVYVARERGCEQGDGAGNRELTATAWYFPRMVAASESGESRTEDT